MQRNARRREMVKAIIGGYVAATAIANGPQQWASLTTTEIADSAVEIADAIEKRLAQYEAL